MNEVQAILADCHVFGINLAKSPKGGLLIDAPAGVVTTDLLRRLRHLKTDILNQLRASDSEPKYRESAARSLNPVEPRQNDPCALGAIGEVAAWGPDGWPVDTVPPLPPCAHCGSRDAWETLVGTWRCLSCDPPVMAQQVLDHVARLRKRHATEPAGERLRATLTRRHQVVLTRFSSD